MDETNKPTEYTSGNEAIDLVVALGAVLQKPRWAYLWSVLSVESNIDQEVNDKEMFEDGLTAQQLLELTDIPQTTLYDDLDRLTSLGALRIRSESQPRVYTAAFLEIFAQATDLMTDEQAMIGIPLLHTVAYGHLDENVEVFINRHGYSTIKDCLTIYRNTLEESEDERTLEDYMFELPEADLAMIKPALRWALEQMDRDPMYGYELPEQSW